MGAMRAFVNRTKEFLDKWAAAIILLVGTGQVLNLLLSVGSDYWMIGLTFTVLALSGLGYLKGQIRWYQVAGLLASSVIALELFVTDELDLRNPLTLILALVSGPGSLYLVRRHPQSLTPMRRPKAPVFVGVSRTSEGEPAVVAADYSGSIAAILLGVCGILSPFLPSATVIVNQDFWGNRILGRDTGWASWEVLMKYDGFSAGPIIVVAAGLTLVALGMLVIGRLRRLRRSSPLVVGGFTLAAGIGMAYSAYATYNSLEYILRVESDVDASPYIGFWLAGIAGAGATLLGLTFVGRRSLAIGRVRSTTSARPNLPSADSPTIKSQVADELQRLTELHRAGALSDSEFKTAKERVLHSN